MLTSTLFPSRFSRLACAMIFLLFLGLPITVHAQFPTYNANFTTNWTDWAVTPTGQPAWSHTGGIAAQINPPTTDPYKLLLTNSTYSYNLSSTTPQCIIAKVRIDHWQTNNDMSRAGISLMSNSSNGEGYCLLFHDKGGTQQLALLNDMQAWGTAVNYSFTVGAWYWFRLQVIGNSLLGKVWKDGSAEPSTWNITQTLGGTPWTLTGGYPGLVASSNGSTTTVSFSNVTVYSPIIYVSPSGNDSNDGYSWGNAKKTLTGALSIAVAGNQIWVQSGTYTNTASYSMKNGVAIYGGLIGTEAPDYDLTQRDFVTNPTVLQGSGVSVFSNSNIDNTAVLDGFTITGGSAANGGGISNSNASPTLQNLIITGNTATGSGTNNGGGIYNTGSSSPTVINTVIANNSADDNGGGVYNNGGTTNFINVTIANNSATTNGGGIYNNKTCKLDNCILSGNTANSGSQLYRNGNTTTLNNSCYFGSMSGSITYNACINSDPLFINPTMGDYRLQSGSLCLDAGNNSYFTMTPANSTYPYDVRGATNGRFINKTTGATGATNGTIDMGAYEYNPLMNFFYVTSTGSSNGTSWSNPTSLQGALNTAFSTCKILVAPGTYTPTATTVLQSNVKLYGGFAGTPGTEILSPADLVNKLNSRNLKADSSVLSNTSAPIVSYSGTVTGALLDGFTITGATGGSAYAVNFPSGTDTIQNCKIINNTGITGGLNLNSSNVATNVLVADNGGVGINFASISAKVINATIANNTGAGINCNDASNSVTNSILWKNNNNFSGSTTPTITYSAGSSNYGTNQWSTGTGNIDLLQRSPNFKNPNNNYKPNRNYELLLISPCLGNGSAAANPLAIDANGKPRKYGTTIDMGAFEKWDGMTVTSGSSSSTSVVKNIRKSFTVPLDTITASNDTMEVQVKPGIIFNMGGSTLKTKWLELMQDTIAPLAAQLMTGSITADSVLYVRRFSKTLNNGTSITKGVWTFFGVPFNTATLNTLDGAVDENTVRIEGYSESSRADNGIGYAWYGGRLNTGSSMTAGIGYALSFNNKVPQNDIGQTVIFSSPSQVPFNESGTPTQNVTLTETPSGSPSPLWYNCGWNLIANPLPQTAGINTMWTTSTPSYYGAAYFYKPYTDSYNVVPATALKTGTGGNAIAPNGAFFVQTDMSGYSATFTAGTGSVSPILQSIAYVRPSSSDVAAAPVHPATFQFHVTGASDYCNTYVIFDPRAHAAMEPMEDNPTMSGMSGTPALQLSTTANGSTTSLAINRLPFTDSTKEVPLQVFAPTAGSYTITMPESDTIANTVLLQDASGSLHDLATGGYTFTTTTNGVTNNYTLIFGSTSTGIQVVKGITIMQDHRTVTITADSTLKQVSLFGVGGQMYFMQNPNSTQLTLQLPAAAGVYLLKIITPEGVITKKMISR